jgi:hypothetical protein
VPVHGGDAQLRGVLQTVQRLVGVQAEVVFEGRIRLAKHVDVRAGAEELLPVTGDDQHVDVVVEARLEDGGVEVLHHLVCVAIDRRVVEREHRHAGVRQVVDQGHGPLLSRVVRKEASGGRGGRRDRASSEGPGG